MTNRITNISKRKAARVAGFGLIIIAIAGGFVFFALNSIVIVPGDAAAKAFNEIKANEWLFVIFIASVLIMITCNVVVILALYVLLKPVSKELALLMGIFRLINTILFAINMVFLFIEPLLFNYIHMIGIIFYALHILVLGYLIFKSGYFPRILGILVMIACFGHLLEFFQIFLFPGYEVIAYPGLAAAMIGEFSFMFWLLIKGAKIPEMKSEN